MKRGHFQAPKECPVCGEDVPRGAAACPHCGADERTGWNEEATRYDGVDLPETEGTNSRSAPVGFPTWLTALIVLVVLGALILSLFLR